MCWIPYINLNLIYNFFFNTIGITNPMFRASHTRAFPSTLYSGFYWYSAEHPPLIHSLQTSRLTYIGHQIIVQHPILDNTKAGDIFILFCTLTEFILPQHLQKRG